MPPVTSPYYEEDFLKLENEVLNISNLGDILIVGDLNARIADTPDFIYNENESQNSIDNILPDNYSVDVNLHRYATDKIFNTQGQGLIDLCIASQLRILNGRYVGDIFGNFTCHKSYGASTVDYALTSVDLINSINFFTVSDPTYLSDHSQISVHISCMYKMTTDHQSNNNNNKLKSIKHMYKWQAISKDKLFEVLQNKTIIDEIVSIENTNFANNSEGIDSATNLVTSLFEKLAEKSCKIVRYRHTKPRKKKPWSDQELKDLKKTVADLGKKMRQHPYNVQIRSSFFKYSMDLKKMVKRKKYLFKKEIFDKLLNWQEKDPKKYWELVNSLKYDNNRNKNNIELSLDFDTFKKHFQTQGNPSKVNEEFSLKIENDLSDYINILNENEVTDKPFSIKEIKECIKNLGMGKSTGPDLIPNEVIKYSSIITINLITKLFNLILESGNYPTNWRKSFIILIYKAGDNLDLNNYRGISLQNCLAKLFSSALNKRLVRYYEDMFANQQFGFRANHRTTDSIFVLKTLISKYLNKIKQKHFFLLCRFTSSI